MVSAVRLGPRRRLRLALPALLLSLAPSASTAAGQGLELEVSGLGAPSEEPLELYSLGLGGEGSVEPIGWISPGQGGWASPPGVAVPAGTRLMLRGEGVWSAPCEVTEGRCRFEIQPGALLHFRFADGSGEAPELPDVFVARGWPRQGGREALEIPVLCVRSTETRAWACSAPRGEKLDLRIDLPGFAPVYRWELEAKPAPDLDLTEVHLLRGAHVQGWIDAGAGIARLQPAGRWREISEERLRFAGREVEIGADGVVDFPNVAPGRYELTVVTPSAGSAELDLVVGDDDERVVLGDVPLERLERIEIQVDPSVDGWGEPWQVSLSRVDDGARASVRRLALDLTGYGSVEELEAGRYYVVVRDSRESTWHLAAYELDGAAPLLLSIPHVPVKGRVRFGDEPLATLLVFGTTQSARQFRFSSDDEGRFEGYLPEEGLWEVELGDPQAGCGDCGGELGVMLVPPVEVEAGPGGKAFVDVALPDTLVEGRVVRGPQGEEVPVAGAQIVAVRPGGPPSRMGRLAQVWSDEEGRFALRGLEPGSLTIGARTDDGGESSWEDVELRDGMETPEIELRIEEKVTLYLRLLQGASPVAGARINVFPRRSISAHVTTGLDGRAEVLVPARSSVVLLVDAPGLGLILDSLAVGDESALRHDVQASQAGGDLLIEGLAAPPRSGSLSRAGGELSMHALRNFAPARMVVTPAGIVFTGLAAGEYRVCLGSTPTCRTVTVPDAGTATISKSTWEESGR